MLSQLPFPKHLAKVATYAAQHHEKLNGSGYSQGLTAKDLPLQSRILAIADIFEALTAADRPYKDSMPISRALEIMGFMKKDGHLDPDVLDLFINNKVFMKFVTNEVDPSLNDIA
jgi:HD-GYP domain-containing protein (c-di-GMP phosphodiesterase class II)